MIHSVLAQRGALDVHIHLLHGPGFPRRARRRLSGMVEQAGGELKPYEIADEEVAGLPTFTEITTTMWYRVSLPSLLPEVERVLYLDGDALAVDSLEALWSTDLEGCLVGAATNIFMQDKRSRSRPAAVGLEGPSAYFNSGVLLMDLDQMRRRGTADEIRRFARSNELHYPDQDALNAVMARSRLELHPRWNCMNSTMTFDWADEVVDADALAEARLRPGIRHFEGPGHNKPWHRDCRAPMKELYFEHRAATPWPKVALQPSKRQMRELRRKRRMRQLRKRLGALRRRASR
jgi:lipopolysaccharide biosynthesis glycosyltransferase